MTYTSYLDLKGNTLHCYDKLTFIINKYKYNYSVRDNYLKFLNEEYTIFKKNDIIFKVLNIKDKYEFCSKYYGYNTYSGDFPVFKIYDYKSLTKLVLRLFKLCDNYTNGFNMWD